MGRLYSFRYPRDIGSTLEPWRAHLGQDSFLGDNDFNAVVSILADRDRAIEDHLNYVSQGRLAYAQSTTLFHQWSSAQSDVRDLTGMSVTVTVPANRVIRITGQALFNAQNAVDGQPPPSIFGYIIENGVALSVFGLASVNFGDGGAGVGLIGTNTFQSAGIIRTPAAGTHTYKLQGQGSGSGSGQGDITGSAAAPAFILVEDIGPVT